MRYPLVIGNWKLHGSKQMTNDLIKDLQKNLHKIKGCNIVIAPPAIYLDRAMNALSTSNIILGAQNVDVNLVGAFTGELSANMLKDIGVKYVIIGHSERRIYHKESNKLIAKKFAVLRNVGLIPVLCIGETKSENISGETEKVCVNQINAILDELDIEAFKNSVIAYEPIWAIGTGISANPEKIQAVHKFIRNYLSNKDAEIAEQVIIQYGGSVNNKNAIDLLYQPDIDGVLVGNSSLKVDLFTEIVKITSIAKENS